MSLTLSGGSHVRGASTYPFRAVCHSKRADWRAASPCIIVARPRWTERMSPPLKIAIDIL